MKLGCCTSLFGEDLQKLSGAGVDYVEIGLWELAEHSAAEIEEKKALLAEQGLCCRAANVMFPGRFRLTGEETNHPDAAPYLEDVLDKAKGLGVETVVFGSGGARAVPEGFSREKAWEQLRELCVRYIVPAFAGREMVCCIEPLRRAECNILTTCKEAAVLVREVDDPHLRLLVDLYHFDVEGEPRSSLPDYAGLLAHAHVASAKNERLLPREGDGEDYGEFFRMLKQAGYTGKVSLEGRVDGDYRSGVAQAARCLRAVMEREGCGA